MCELRVCIPFFIIIITRELDSTLQINHKMSASNDELLFIAAMDGKLAKVIELLSKGTGTGYRNKVSYESYVYYFNSVDDDGDNDDADDDYVCC